MDAVTPCGRARGWRSANPFETGPVIPCSTVTSMFWSSEPERWSTCWYAQALDGFATLPDVKAWSCRHRNELACP